MSEYLPLRWLNQTVFLTTHSVHGLIPPKSQMFKKNLNHPKCCYIYGRFFFATIGSIIDLRLNTGLNLVTCTQVTPLANDAHKD